MTLLVPTLMAYSLVGEFAHEVAGLAMATLLAAHLWLNRAWVRALPHRRLTRGQAAHALAILLASACMAATVATGVSSSRYVFAALPVHAESSALELVHITCSHWGLVFMGLHAGLSTGRYVRPPLRRRPRTSRPLGACALLTSCWGAAAFFRRGVWRYLLLLNHFAFMDPSEVAPPFILDYLAVIALFVATGALLSHIENGTPKAQCPETKEKEHHR